MGSLVSCVAGRWRGGGREDTGPFPIAAVLPRTKGGDAGGSPRGPRALGGAAAAGGGTRQRRGQLQMEAGRGIGQG